jgi:hypothetical protein
MRNMRIHLMNDKIIPAPDGNCRVHPSQSHEWDGSKWFCGKCYFGEQPESTYGKVLEQVKKAMYNQDACTYSGDPSAADQSGIEAAENIMRLIEERDEILKEALEMGNELVQETVEKTVVQIHFEDERDRPRSQ